VKLRALAVAFLTALPPAAWSADLAGTFKGKSVVLVSIDTLRADRLGAYGYARPTSPALDALAAQSQVFLNCYSHSPKTAESHMSLMTGVLPPAHGVMNWTREGRMSVSRAQGLTSLAESFQKAGYRTLAYTSGGNVAGVLGFSYGFDSYSDAGRSSLQLAPLVLEDLLRSPQPFFLFVHTYAVHDPYMPRPEFARMFTDPAYAGRMVWDPEVIEKQAKAEGRGRQNHWFDLHDAYWSRVTKSAEDLRQLSDLYDAGIRQMDQDLKRLLDVYERAAAKGAVLMLVSDHGEEFAEHGQFTHSSLYQEVLHVPLVLRLPGVAASRAQTVVPLSDAMPTLLELAGLPVPEHVQARSLLPILAGRDTRDRPVASDWIQRGARALRIGPLKLIRDPDAERLFDLDADPGEKSNLLPEAKNRSYPLKLALDRIGEACVAVKARFGAGKPTSVDPETRKQLEALGYVGP
jgi:arylsulfatase A-like enzyme